MSVFNSGLGPPSLSEPWCNNNNDTEQSGRQNGRTLQAEDVVVPGSVYLSSVLYVSMQYSFPVALLDSVVLTMNVCERNWC